MISNRRWELGMGQAGIYTCMTAPYCCWWLSLVLLVAAAVYRSAMAVCYCFVLCFLFCIVLCGVGARTGGRCKRHSCLLSAAAFIFRTALSWASECGAAIAAVRVLWLEHGGMVVGKRGLL